jgi:hypothetical protein
MKFLVTDYNSYREYLMDAKEVLKLINGENSQQYRLKDLQSDWECGVTKILSNVKIRRAV